MNQTGPDGMWDEEDGFYYDVLRLPDGSATRLKVRSMVGLLPICATTVIEPWQRERAPRVVQILTERLRRMPELLESIHPTGPGHLGYGGRGIAALVNPERLRRILSRMLDENEFLSPYGIRALSRYHAEHPYVFNVAGQEYRVNYLPAESDTGMFGGNSNWRGPIWMPVNALLIRALMSFYLYLRRQLQNRVSDRFGQVDEPVRGGPGNCQSANRDLSARWVWPAAGVRRYGEISDRSAVERLHPVLRIFPRRQWRGPWSQPPDGLDRCRREADRTLRPP